MIDTSMVGHRTVIVGASVGGFAVAERMREIGYAGRVTVIGDESHPPYGRPPLSKQVLAGVWAPEEAIIASPERSAKLGLELRLGVRATGLDTGARVVRLDDGRIEYDELVIATGVRARTPAGPRGLAGLHTFRTWGDAVRVRTEAATARRALVVGAGVLGSELAAGLTKSGLEVTLVGRAERITFGQVGSLLSPLIEALHRDHGVDVRLGTQTTSFLGDDRVTTAVLSDGTAVDTDLVVFAAGSEPNVEWLGGAVPVDDGVVCDASGRAAPGVHAVGDVARWAGVRVEHQQNAIEQGRAIADMIVLGRPAEAALPFFWSELYGSRIQAYGRFGGDALEVVDGSITDGRFVAAELVDGRMLGAVGWNHPRAFREARVRIDSSERQLTP
jgi:NADPH-dependent 2,4-dienoyl-CoA reductase/sulfur reductase-like enzyme